MGIDGNIFTQKIASQAATAFGPPANDKRSSRASQVLGDVFSFNFGGDREETAASVLGGLGGLKA